MKKWVLKAIIQKAISFLPQAHKINYQVQKFSTLRKGMPDQFFIDRLQHFTQHYEFFKRYNSVNQKQYSVLELGTGWHPIVPIGFYLSGANHILTIDIRKLISSHSLAQTIQKFECFFNRGELIKYIPDLDPGRMQNLIKLAQCPIKDDPYSLLKYLNITGIKQDARKLDLPAESLDLIISNNVLQDIPPFILDDIFKEFYRVLKNDGIISCAVDFCDQYANFDSQISPLNYLQFSDSQWHLVTNRLVRQNRERIPYYRQLLSKSNFPVLEEVKIIGPKQVLESINLHPKFKNIPPEDLLVLQSHFACRKEPVMHPLNEISEDESANYNLNNIDKT